MASLPFELHLTAPACFFSVGGALRAYRNEKAEGYAPPLATKSLFGVVATVFLLRSAKAIPLYPVGIPTVKTYRAALRALLRNEAVLLFIGAEDRGAPPALPRFLATQYEKRRGTPLPLRRIYPSTAAGASLGDALPYPHPHLSFHEVMAHILEAEPPRGERSV